MAHRVYDKMQVIAVFVVFTVALFHVIHRGRGPEFSVGSGPR